ncbi:MAG: hypothetical protein EBS35_04370 [Bacteroidetes bacterium]|nr:hypothetical protein [Bacteroidota bacterium]
MKHIFFYFLFSLFSLVNFAQSANQKLIFEIGKDEQNYRNICEAYPETLLTWKKDDYTQTALLWFDFLKSMETYAESIQFNLNGLKLWLHIFWNEKGNIDYLGYYIHPASRQIDKTELNAFLSSFSRLATKPDFKSGLKISHYTSATFPTFAGKR